MYADIRLARLAPLLMIAALAGCADLYGVLDHLVGAPESAPPLGESFLGVHAGIGLAADGRPIPPDINGGRTPTVNDVGTAGRVLQPAQGATIADLAGVWVHAAGYGAVHIDESGRIYQVDIAETLRGEPLPPLLPRTLFNVGSAGVAPDGRIEARASISLFGLSACGTVTGTLDSTRTIIYDVVADLTADRGNGPEHAVDFLPWLRWDPQTGALAQ